MTNKTGVYPEKATSQENKIASKSSSRSGSTASATATANLYKGSKVIKTSTKTVKLSCSKNGTLY